MKLKIIITICFLGLYFLSFPINKVQAGSCGPCDNGSSNDCGPDCNCNCVAGAGWWCTAKSCPGGWHQDSCPAGSHIVETKEYNCNDGGHCTNGRTCVRCEQDVCSYNTCTIWGDCSHDGKCENRPCNSPGDKDKQCSPPDCRRCNPTTPTPTSTPGGPTATPTATPIPTATPTVTASPIPTATSTPTPVPPTATSTPTPTKIPCGNPCTRPDECEWNCPYCVPGPGGNNICQPPSPTPTPTVIQAACQCDSISYTGNFAPGGTATFTILAKVNNPDTYRAKVIDIVYHLQQNGVEIANSGPRPASYLERKTVSGVVADYYTTSWTYTFDSIGSGVNYFRVYADPSDIHCGWRTAQQYYPQVMVLAESTNTNSNAGMFGIILNFLRGLLGGRTTLTPQSGPGPTLSPTPLPVVITPTGTRSLQLGTFGPYGVTAQSCTGLEFWINYDWR